MYAPHVSTAGLKVRERTFSRNPRCGAKLKEPTADPRAAFCCAGCFKNGTALRQVGFWPDGSLYNPNNYPEQLVRAAVAGAEARQHERRSRAAKRAAVAGAHVMFKEQPGQSHESNAPGRATLALFAVAGSAIRNQLNVASVRNAGRTCCEQ